MNEFVSWCRHLLVSFLFHALTSLHPPSFYRNDFSTCINKDCHNIRFSIQALATRNSHNSKIYMSTTVPQSSIISY